MRMPPLPADFTHSRACKPICEKSLTLPISGARECSPLAGTKCRNILGLLVFLLAENEATQDARMLPVEERKSALLEF